MKKLLLSCLFILFSQASNAQLAANPWDPSTLPEPNNGYFGDNLEQKALENTPNAPAYKEGITDGEVLPVDPWALTRDRSGIQTWRGSAQHGKLNYIGEATTYGTATGQEMIAPEVNRHNMVVMLDHLRSLGYKIPENYNEGVMGAPARYGAKLKSEYNELMHQNIKDNPLGGLTKEFINMFDDYTGLETENLLMNSVKLLGTD
ncbi:MAG: hypothetical protein R3Y43_00695 [Alphaproteobacteria bacterium]